MKKATFKFRFSFLYFSCGVLLFAIELLIGIYAHDKVIRPYGGDFLVVILIYCFVKSFFESSVFITAMSVLLFAYTVELTQYFHLINLLSLQHSTIARMVLGTSFSWTDLLCYTFGILLILIVEKQRSRTILNTIQV